MDFSNRYIVLFALAMCLACSLVVSTFAVGLKERQLANKALDQQRNIVVVAGLIEAEPQPTAEQVAELFANVKTYRVDRATGEVLETIEFGSFDPIKASKDPGTSTPNDNRARVKALPDEMIVCEITTPGKECLVLPIWGNGLWSTLYGYLAIKTDASEVVGLTYYEQLETPGLGGEVTNPLWKAQWPGKKLFDGEGELKIEVVKNGTKGDTSRSDYYVDGISGATITSVAVTHMLRLWLGPDGYGPYLSTRT